MKQADNYTSMLKGEAALPPYFFVLAPAGFAYSVIMRLRTYMYRSGVLGSKKLGCRVVSVGNLTAGGTGKTPMTVHIVKRLKEMGLSVAVLTRGYGGSREGETLVVSDGSGTVLPAEQSGDEPALLAKLLPGVPVVMGADRCMAGLLALEKFSPDVVVLDDGFQHIRLMRDLDILLMDAVHPFGNGMVLPAGYLREPADACGRADIIILTRSGRLSPAMLDNTVSSVSARSGGRPVLTADHRPSMLAPVWGGPEQEPGYISGKSVYAFCGIAEPASFALILENLGAKIINFKAFSDHHPYTAGDLRALEAEAVASGAELLVTTGKDAVKLSGLPATAMEMYSVGVEMSIDDGAGLLGKMLEERVLGR